MKSVDASPARFEQLEPRLLLNAGFVSSELFDAAQVLSFNPTDSMSLLGSIQADGPIQTYRFQASARGTLWVDMCARDSQLDPLLQVYRQDSRRVARNDDAGDGSPDSRVGVRVTSGENYYVVASAQDGTIGSYELRLTGDPVDDAGNSLSLANSLAVSGGRAQATNVINYAGDTDVFRIVADRAGQMEVDLLGASQPGVAPELYVYDANGNQLAYASAGMGNHAHASLEASAGDVFYLMAADSSPNPVLNSRSRLGVNLAGDDLPNDIANAALLALVGGKATLKGITNYTGDVDVVRVVAPSTASMTVAVTGPSKQGGFIGEVFVYDANGNQVAHGASANGRVSLSVGVLRGQNYYIKIAGAYTWSARSYTLEVACPLDDTGNTFTDGSPVALTDGAGLRTAKIEFPSDVDMFSAVSSMTGVMTVEVTASGRNNSLDPTVTIYNSDFQQVAYDDDSGAGLNSSVSFNVTNGKTYYVLVGSYGNATAGQYTVKFSTIEDVVPDPDPDPDPNPDPQPDPNPDPGGDPTPGSYVVAELLDTGGGYQLRVLGTNGDDVITLSQSASTITVTSGTWTVSFTSSLLGLLVYGFDGNDTIRLTSEVTVPGTIYGGDGNDSIFDAGLAGMTIYGDAGDDLLVAVGGGGDTLRGGTGLDSFWCDSSDSVADASSAETSAASVHFISAFYQPYTTDPLSPDYVSLRIAGQNLTDPAATSSASRWANFASVPLFVDGPQYNDIAQGAIGDCYYLASLAALADTDPTIISQMITSLGDGTYAVRYYRSGAEVYLRVDADLPVNSYGSLVYAKTGADGELWAPLVEKAYAFFRYGENSYASINGGWMSTVLREVTGGYTSTTYTSGSVTALFDQIAGMLSAGHAVTLGSTYNAASPVVAGHAYAIKSTEIVGGQRYVTIYNPWGVDGRTWAGDDNYNDGLLTLSIQQIQDNFTAAVASLA